MKKNITLIAIALLAACVCFYSGILAANNKKEDHAELSAVVVTQQLSEIEELSTVRYNYTNMGQFKDYNNFYGVTIPFTTKKFIVSYDGVIKAGIDLGKVAVDIRDNTITITLPKASILSHEIDNDSLEIFDEVSGIFNPLTIEDYNQFQIDQKKVMEEKALSKGLLSEAQEKAEAAITRYLSALSGDTVYTVEFVYSE